MHPTICSRCKKNIAVIFITKIENGKTTNEGICLKCASELGLKPVDDIMKRMGITEEDIDSVTNEMMSVMGDSEGLVPVDYNEQEEGRTATFPFLNRLFNAPGGGAFQAPDDGAPSPREKNKKDFKPTKRRFLDNYCISLTEGTGGRSTASLDGSPR